MRIDRTRAARRSNRFRHFAARTNPAFNTRLRGNGSQGHDFGTALLPQDKAALLEYLRTL